MNLVSIKKKSVFIRFRNFHYWTCRLERRKLCVFSLS